MDYENLYQTMQAEQKAVKDNLAALQKLFKAIGRETEGGDLKSVSRDLQAMAEKASGLSASLEALQDTVSGFDAEEYFKGGEFAEQMLLACEEMGIDVRGEFPVYEMFPYKVRLDAENQDVYMDRKKVQCMRPKNFAERVKKGQEKLNKAFFNEQTFANELADAYDVVILKKKRRPGADIYLNSLYKCLAPMGRFRREYDQQSFAFDLARLYMSGIEETKSGRKFQFGPSRDNGKAIRILDKEGKEQFFATIRFYE